MENQNLSQTGEAENILNVSFDMTSVDHLRRLSLWAKITSLCAFISYIFTLIAAFFGRPAGQALMDDNSAAQATVVKTSGILGAFLVVIIGGAINYFLYRFAVTVGKGVRHMDPLEINGGFDSLRVYFKIVGILLIILFSVIFLGILVVLLGGGNLLPAGQR